MRRVSGTAMLLTVLVVTPAIAHAGWISQWTNTLVKTSGERVDPQAATMAIDNGRVRMQQPEVITLLDYNAGRFTMINPAKHTYWTGTVDEYVAAVTKNRSTQLRQQFAAAGLHSKKLRDNADAPSKVPAVDVSKLPPVSITKTDMTERIAGYDTVKYEARADGTLFQEFWVAPALNVSTDLDPTRFIAVQQKMSTGMAGKSADQYNALYRNDDYRKVVASGFVLKIVNHHLGGQFERVATAMRQGDVPASDFEVPASYRRVALSDVLEAPPAQGS